MQDEEPEENTQRHRHNQRVEEMEIKWGVFEGVQKEWSESFEKLLEYHNAQDFGSRCRSLFGNKPTMNDELHKKDVLYMNELRDWMIPGLSPPFWKYYVLPRKYKEEKAKYDDMKHPLFKILRGDTGISKHKFLKGIIKEVRSGNIEVC